MLVPVLTLLALVSNCAFRVRSTIPALATRAATTNIATRLEQALCQTERHSDNRYRLLRGFKTANASAIWSHNATYTGCFNGSGDDMIVVKYESDN
jgi:hypothetical protein